MYKFEDLTHLVRKDAKMQIPIRLLCLDPGETTGWALFENGKLARWGQIQTIRYEKLLWRSWIALFREIMPTCVICEDYRIYQHKLQRHTFSPVMTLRLIGGIDLLCHDYDVPIYYQMASQAKTFITDQKLKDWNFWQEGMKHSRDAIRHGCYFLLVHKK